MKSIRYYLFSKLATEINNSVNKGSIETILVYRDVYNKIIDLVPDGLITEELLERSKNV